MEKKRRKNGIVEKKGKRSEEGGGREGVKGRGEYSRKKANNIKKRKVWDRKRSRRNKMKRRKK